MISHGIAATDYSVYEEGADQVEDQRSNGWTILISTPLSYGTWKKKLPYNGHEHGYRYGNICNRRNVRVITQVKLQVS